MAAGEKMDVAGNVVVAVGVLPLVEFECLADFEGPGRFEFGEGALHEFGFAVEVVGVV